MSDRREQAPGTQEPRVEAVSVAVGDSSAAGDLPLPLDLPIELSADETDYILSPAPHILSSVTTQRLMLNVLVALAPALVASLVFFGLNAALVVATAVASSVAFEYLWCKLRGLPNTVGDLSAVVTGVLLAFNLPATIAPYMVVVGAFVAIILVKELFGGIGCNFANPAIVARIVLSVSFPAAMTNYLAPQLLLSGVDAVSAATRLAPSAQNVPVLDLFLGSQMGVLGETSALAILIGFVILLATRTISWHVPVIYVGLIFVFSALAGFDPFAQIFSGGLMLGAVFMATDYVTSPLTIRGKLLFAVGLALITCLIRFWGNMNEGVAYAILIMNLLVPYIDARMVDTPLGMEHGKEAKSHGSH